MARQILVFGNNEQGKAGFRTREELVAYIADDICRKGDFRYRHTVMRNLRFGDVIVLCWQGSLYGHFDIDSHEPPRHDDTKKYDKTKRVYIVRASTLYRNPTELSAISSEPLRRNNSVPLSEEQFCRIEDLAIGSHTFQFIPGSTVALELVLRAVRRRLGQSEFRMRLMEAYQSKCAVTGYDALDALEAAHIEPYSNVESNHPSNGLLLRADIHALFDEDLLAIHPETLVVTLALSLRTTNYQDLQGKPIASPRNESDSPNRAALDDRWQKFCRQNENGDGLHGT